jgi:hypothetical protein
MSLGDDIGTAVVVLLLTVFSDDGKAFSTDVIESLLTMFLGDRETLVIGCISCLG